MVVAGTQILLPPGSLRGLSKLNTPPLPSPTGLSCSLWSACYPCLWGSHYRIGLFILTNLGTAEETDDLDLTDLG